MAQVIRVWYRALPVWALISLLVGHIDQYGIPQDQRADCGQREPKPDNLWQAGRYLLASASR